MLIGAFCFQLHRTRIATTISIFADVVTTYCC